ncbi:MAG: Hpt domain-containing protein [Bacteroidota bacterium]|nr:Hpt domain-containing protein [Bacteroidota bacterium]
MINNESKKNNVQKDAFGEKVCDLSYLAEMMGNKNHLIKNILDTFLVQISEELQLINDAIEKSDYVAIKQLAHTIKTSVSIMSISTLTPVLQEMETLGAMATDIEKIKQLNVSLNSICKRASNEIKIEINNYN